VSRVRTLWGDTIAGWAAAFDAMERGECVPGCATGDHGECNIGSCTCQRLECKTYRHESFAELVGEERESQ
jgi:hypothetical protein